MPVENQIAHFDALTRTEAWILDAAYGHWRDLALARADLVVALDYARLTSLVRLIRRTAARIVRREEVCNGNRETFRGAVLARDGILWWHSRSFRRKRTQMPAPSSRREDVQGRAKPELNDRSERRRGAAVCGVGDPAGRAVAARAAGPVRVLTSRACQGPNQIGGHRFSWWTWGGLGAWG
jgi:hypothetical protein